jgi:CRP-like cAMP-binding protein
MTTQPLLLSGLSEAHQAELLAAGKARLLRVRDVLGRQGDPADVFALVQIGHLKLGQAGREGNDTLVRFVGPGDCYGAVALVAGSRYPVSATAVEPTRALIWTRDTIVGFADRIPRLKTNILEEVTRRMAGVLTAAHELATERVPQRLARALLRAAVHGGIQEPAGLRIVHPLTRQELAELSGTTLFTVSRLMSRWESDGLIRTGRGAVTIVDAAGLEAAAEAEPA